MAHAGGRPTKYDVNYAEKVYKLCLLGATDKDIANFFDVDEDTIAEWKNKHFEFSESLKRGKVDADTIVASKLYHRAIGYEHNELITASYQGKITDTMEVVKHYPPDTTAAIFWLKNRQPEKWRDVQKIEHSGEINNPLAGLTADELRKLVKDDNENTAK